MVPERGEQAVVSLGPDSRQQRESQCADSLHMPVAGAEDGERTSLESSDGERYAEEDPDMSIFSEQQPRDVVHLETVYEDSRHERDVHPLQHEDVYTNSESSKALEWQQQVPAESVNLKHLNNIRQQWTLYRNENTTSSNASARVLFETNVNHSTPEENGVTSTCITNIQAESNGEQRADEKKVFVRRGDSAPWRMWQEILGQNKVTAKLYACYRSAEPIVMCFPAAISIFMNIEGKPVNDKSKVFAEARDERDNLLIGSPFSTIDNRIDMEFTAMFRGHVTVNLRCIGPKSLEIIPYTLKVSVSGNNPLLSFSDEGNWPVAIAYCRTGRLIYVAYSNYISQYRECDTAVEYSKQLAFIDDGHYNDLALSPDGSTLVASYSGWTTVGIKFRHQAIHMYDTGSGRIVHTVCNEFPAFVFDSPILHLAPKAEHTFVVADRASLCECSTETGLITSRLTVESLGSVSRIAYSDDRYYIADADKGYVKIYDGLGCLEKSFQVRTYDGDQMNGMTGLAVDQSGNIIVCDCLSGTINVYRPDGRLICSLDSDWDPVAWPLQVSATGDGHIFVVDHRHACVKKFKYL